jgi:PAS domain S-box-containing protein
MRENDGGSPGRPAAAPLHRSVAQAAIDGYCRLDLQGRVLEANDAYCRMSGYSEGELLAMRVTDLEANDAPADVAARIEQVVAQGHGRFETVHRRKDGARWHVEISARYHAADGGSVLAFVRETGDRPLDRVLRDPHARPLERFFNQSPDAFYVSAVEEPQAWDDHVDKEAVLDYLERHQRLIDVNDAMLAQYGARREDLIGRPIGAFFEHDTQTGRRLRRRLLEEGRLQTETCERRDDGSAVWFEGDYLCLRDDQQRILGTFGTQRDITARKRAEEALRESEARLKEAQHLARLGDWSLELSTGALRWSEESVGVFEIDRAALGASYEAFLAAIHPEDRADVERAHARSLAVGAPFEIVHRVLTTGGRVKHVQTRFQIVADDGGRPVRLVGTVQDVTERRNLEVQLLQSQKMEAVGRLAGGVAHDFNNILTAILTHVNLLDANPGLDPAAGDGVREIGREAQRAADLTRQLLLFGRRSELRTSRIDLGVLVANLQRMLRRLIGEHIGFEMTAERDLPAIEAERSMIEQVIVNLCVNARDAMPAGGRLEVRASRAERPAATGPDGHAGPWVCLAVTDSGSGMDDATLRHAFEPFFTTKETGKGTGLGLASVHAIVHQHHGHVEAESAVGRGSTFRVYLPAVPGLPIAEQEPGPGAEPRGGHESILLVEDEPGVRTVVTKLLVKWGYRVVTAANGSEALERWAEDPAAIDLLYTDLVMPGGIDGIALATRLRAERPDLKVVLSTGYSGAILNGGSEAIPGAAVVPKPFQQAGLLATIRALLDGR